MFLEDLKKIKDNELLTRFSALVQTEREAVAAVVWHLSEIDRRRLYAKEGYSSLFSYCTEKFHYSEAGAFLRIQAARAVQKFPEILLLLEEGKIHLTTLKLISPILTPENKDLLLVKVQGMSKRAVEELVAGYSPFQREIPDKIRRLPVRTEIPIQDSVPISFSIPTSPQEENRRINSAKEETAQKITRSGTSGLPQIQAEERKVKIEFVASERLAKKIERARELLRHKFPKGRLEEIFEESLELLLEKKDPERKMAKRQQIEKEKIEMERGAEAKKENLLGKTPKKEQLKIVTRYIPEKLKLQIWQRDGGCCTYVSYEGKRCGEKNFLELDHLMPWSFGGESSFENLRLLCRSHNQLRISNH